MDLYFIINGTETVVSCKENESLKDVLTKVINQTGNDHKQWWEFQMILNDKTVNTNLNVGEIEGLNDQSFAFLSTKAGYGG
jgi:hypothetical protein